MHIDNFQDKPTEYILLATLLLSDIQVEIT